MTEITLATGFRRSAKRFPERPALEVAGEAVTYGELEARAAAIAATIAERSPAGAPPLTAVYASRSVSAFGGVLGALLAGHGYVPLNPSFPVDRCRDMLLRSGARTLVVDGEREERIAELLAGVEDPPALIRPDAPAERLASPQPILGASPDGDVAAQAASAPGAPPAAGARPDDIAYLLFTSGSTGTPKGVGVTHANATAFVDAAVDRYGVHEHDRCSQTFDMTFDLSVFDMFVAWQRGACLCCPSERELMAPGRFIRRSELTIWFSVPSTGAFMRKLRMLKPDSYPTLRWSLFCGEPLPVEVAAAWAEAAPNSIVENLYGPTEATIACTVERFTPETAALAVNGIVPIGAPLGEMTALVAGPDLREVAPGEDGELLMAGPQVTPGYWRDPEKTAVAFVVPPGRSERHYRTGDRVRRPLEPGAPLVYIGRMDHQIKVLGHRVELGEIEAVLREESGVDAAIAVGWPVTDSGAGGIAAFVGDTTIDVAAVREAMAARLPDYMVPRRIDLLDELPLNANGKFDRKRLLARLDQPAPARVT